MHQVHPAKTAAAAMARRHRRIAERIGEIEEMSLGLTMHAALIGLVAEPMDSANAVRVRVLWERLIRHLQAQAMVATADALDGTGQLPGLQVHERTQIISQELACSLNVDYATAYHDVTLTSTVADHLPKAWEALNAGALSLAHVRAVETATDGCPDRVIQAVDAQAVPLAIDRGWTPARLRKAAVRIVMTIDPDGAAERAAAAKQSSDVKFRPEPNEMGTVTARGDGLSLRDVMNILDDRAEALGRAGDARPVGVRRVDALIEAVLGQTAGMVSTDGEVISAPASPGSGGAGGGLARPMPARRRDAHLTLSLDAYLGATNTPGEIAGYGPITADTARRIAADSSLRRLVTDPLTGAAIDLGHTRYPPSQFLRDYLAARDQTCMMPSCDRPARKCEADHRVEANRSNPELGGKTDRDNLGLLCPQHHDGKTKKLWHVTDNPDGTRTWTSPLGRTYTKKADPFPIELLEPPDDNHHHFADDAGPEILDADPDPPYPDDPLPDAPPLSIEEFYDYLSEIDREIFDDANRGDYDDIIAIRNYRLAS